MQIFTHFPNRKTEWILALYTLGFGLWLIAPWPNPSMNPDSFRHALWMMTETNWGGIYAVVGLIHCTALHINGRAAWTPFGRLGAVFLNMQVFWAITIGLFPANPFGTGVYTYGFFGTVWCGVCLVVAAADCGKEYRIWRGKHGTKQ